ncbi:MAG: histidine kinase [Crocinitomicaceae bacterium]|nr:histidine kinase [Crocinitomicaceae bacterium]
MKPAKKKYGAISKRMVKTIILLVLIAIAQYTILSAQDFSKRIILTDVISTLIFTITFTSIIYIIQHYYHSKEVLNVPNISTIVLFSFLTILWSHLATSAFAETTKAYNDFYNLTFTLKSILIVLVYIICHLIFWIDQQKVQEVRIQKFAIEKEKEANRIEMNSLQQQFKPHFLFNSLNSINALTISNPVEAQKMVHLLSEFMRCAINVNQSDLVYLDQEIRHIQLYTDIEKVRFGSRLEVNYNVPKDLKKHKLPSLILQPVIENAIKYGLYDSTDVVSIEINVEKLNHNLIISISNPFDPDTQSASKGTGYGLQSIEKKMLILYNQSNLLQTNAENKLFTTTLKIPQQ